MPLALEPERLIPDVTHNYLPLGARQYNGVTKYLAWLVSQDATVSPWPDEYHRDADMILVAAAQCGLAHDGRITDFGRRYLRQRSNADGTLRMVPYKALADYA